MSAANRPAALAEMAQQPNVLGLNLPLTIMALLLTGQNRLDGSESAITSMTTATKRQPSLRFRGGSFMALILRPVMPIDGWLTELDKWLSRSPEFFHGKSVVMDVSGLSLKKREFVDLTAKLKDRGIRILGMQGAHPSWNDIGLPPLLSASRSAESLEAPGAAPSQPLPPAALISSLVIDEPVRSGQSIVHDGDVTIIGSVASGAEIVASGSIHVYGALRGRVLAGSQGNPKARIFCRRLEAELMAIDGYYLVADELDGRLRNTCIHAWLEDAELKIATLD
jgi:septum site-determining protein MinC